MRGRKIQWGRHLEGYAFISPFLLGLGFFVIGPVVACFGLAFTRWNLFTPPEAIGAANFSKLFHDPLFYQSLWVTFYYTILAVPLGIAFALVLALLVNEKIRGVYLFRTAFFMPNIVSGVAMLIVWMWILEPQYGLINQALDSTGATRALEDIGIGRPGWLTSPELAVPALVLMSLAGVGGAMLILLAGLQNIPPSLSEAAEIDGAGSRQKFIHITLPLLTPTIFFLLVVGVIGSFQTFNQAFIMTNGGPARATFFYSLYIYKNAFEMYRMGYACAMAVILFAIIFAITTVQVRLSRRWVHYQ